MTRTRYTKKQAERDQAILSANGLELEFKPNKNLTLELIGAYMEQRNSANVWRKGCMSEADRPLRSIIAERLTKWWNGRDL